MIKLFGKAIRVNKASQDKDTLDVGANLFIGNLDPDVDEKVLQCMICICPHMSFLILPGKCALLLFHSTLSVTYYCLLLFMIPHACS